MTARLLQRTTLPCKKLSLATAAIVALALAGCGGSGPDTASADSTSADAGDASAQAMSGSRNAQAAVAAGTYSLQVVSSGLCLSIAGASTANGAKTQQATCADNAAQHFTLSAETGGSYRFVNVGSGKSLDVTDVSTANGALIQQWTTSATNNQRFAVTASGGGSALKGVASSKCVDVKDHSTAVGGAIQQWDCSGGTNQQWKLVPVTAASSGADLTDPAKKEIAMELVSSAENSSLNWRAQYAYIEDIGDGRGYTAGIIGFCSGTGDMLELVQSYTATEPGNVLAKYLTALKKVNNTDSHSGLDPNYQSDWKKAATDTVFQKAQDAERDAVYFNPSVTQAKTDGLRTLGQFIYYDAIVMHGPGDDGTSFGGIRKAAMAKAKTPAQGGNETTYLNAFLDARVAAMKTEEAHSDTTRVDTEQRVFLQNGNFDLNTPLSWKVYGDPYSIK
jgi:chitosanase